MAHVAKTIDNKLLYRRQINTRVNGDTVSSSIAFRVSFRIVIPISEIAVGPTNCLRSKNISVNHLNNSSFAVQNLSMVPISRRCPFSFTGGTLATREKVFSVALWLYTITKIVCTLK